MIILPKLNRRQLLHASAMSVAGMVISGQACRLFAAEERPSFPIGACDWSLGKEGSIKAIHLAKQIGLDGVQCSFGAPGDGDDLRKPAVREAYATASKETGVAIASLAMGVLNRVPLATEDRAEQWVGQCIDTMTLMSPKPQVVLLAFFGKADIKQDRDKQDELIKRLKRLAPKAESADVILGIESGLNTDDLLRILDAVNSPAVQAYYDVANMQKRGYDVYGGIRKLGKERICEIHAKEYDHLIGHGKIDFEKVHQAIVEIDWHGWIVLERATIESKPLEDCYRENYGYLKRLFG